MSVQNFSFLARLEVAEKFVVVGWWWSRPSLGFSFSQAEQKDLQSLCLPIYVSLRCAFILKEDIQIRKWGLWKSPKGGGGSANNKKPTFQKVDNF